MEELKKAFYEVMNRYGKSFGELGVMKNLKAWEIDKAPLINLLRAHPNWNEAAKAVVLDFKEGRGIEKDAIDEIAFTMLGKADETVTENDKAAFHTAFRAAVSEYSSTLSEQTLEIIRQNGQIPCTTGQKTSRIIGKLCHKFGLDSCEWYNNIYARLSDALNPLQIQKTAVLSVHPCDFLEMSSKKNTWKSCHNLADGGYQAGTLSYMTDDVSLIFFTVDPEVTECFYNAPRRTRQMFFYKDRCLYQSRLYPAYSDEIMEQNRSIVHKILATCLGVPNLWILKTKRESFERCCDSAPFSAQYPDYDYYGNLSVIKGMNGIAKMTIGEQPICVCCGKKYISTKKLKCNCDDVVVCNDCGRTVLRKRTVYMDNSFHCHGCLNICSCCGKTSDENMYQVLDRRGELLALCPECYNSSLQPCAVCSVKAVCDIIGNSLCQHIHYL